MLIPPGVYIAEIIEGVVKETISGRHVLVFTFHLTEGINRGRKVEGRWYIPFQQESTTAFPELVKLDKNLPDLIDKTGTLDPARVIGKTVRITVYHKLTGAMQTVERVSDVGEEEALPDEEIDGARFQLVERQGEVKPTAEPASGRYEVEEDLV